MDLASGTRVNGASTHSRHPQGTVHQVRKRDGQTVQVFDFSKIENAIRKAWQEASPGTLDEGKLHAVTMWVANTLDDSEVGVEKIQDAVEIALMKYDLYAVAKAYVIYRHKHSELRQARQKPDPVAVSDYIHFAKYARFMPDAFRRELFPETIDRVEAMHLRRFAHVEGLPERIRWAFDRVREKRVLPSMRSMQFGGAAVENNNNRIYNCSFTHIDRPRAFAEAIFLLLSGCGVGYSVQFDHVEKLPPLGYVDGKTVVHHVIADTIEGWADALDALVRGFIDGVHIEFSYHLIRAAGTPLKTSGGRAPGHMKLKESLEAIRLVLSGAQGRKLRPIECHDIMCHAADAVLSGGIRRSAMIALFSLEDSEMVVAKTGNWWKTHPWRSNANNSVAIKRDEVKKKAFKRIFQMIREWGEPGFFFCSDYDHGTNPCVPAGTRILTRDGYRAIETLVDQTTVVWNGKQWSSVEPRVTGHDQPMLRVRLSDGTSLDCTDYHEWCLAGGDRVKAKDLLEGDALEKFSMPVVESGEDMAHAYTHGFWCGDGTVEDAGRKTAMLYGVKKALVEHLDVERTTGDNAALDRIRAVLPQAMPDKFVVPLDASPRSRLDWFAGLLDADGTEARSPASLSLQIVSVNLAFLRDVRLMLTTLGVQAKISDANDEGVRTLPDGRGAEREYTTQRTWRLLLNGADTLQLVRLGMRTHRIDLALAQKPPQRDARRFVTVAAVERLANAPTVYCFTEETNHTGTFEGIVTAQCAEIGLDPKLVITEEILQLLMTRRLAGKTVPAVAELGDTHTGWAFCNLCEINAATFKTFEDFKIAAEAATIIGTCQASYTNMPYLGWVSETLAERDALLGIGMTGMMDAPDVSLNPNYQRFIAEQVKLWNAEIARMIGIEPAARTTCVKPSGTTSLELGCVGSGHHAHHAKRYIRRVTADEYEIVFQAFKAVNPHMCVRKPDGKWVVEFPVEAPEGAMLKEHLGAVQFLDMVRSTQKNWVLPGTARASHSPGLNHNVSNTVSVKPYEWDAAADYIWEHRADFTGVTLIADTSDKAYSFAPNEAVTTEADEVRWNQLVSQYKPVDFSAILETEDGTALTAEAACASGACAIV